MAAEGARPTAKMWFALVGMTLASSMILVDQTAVPLASPDVVIDLGADLALGQWILTANVLPLAAFLVLGGRLADIIGLRKAFVGAAVAFAVATAMAGAAQDITWMLSARVLQGLAAAVLMPATVAITSVVWPKERRGFALGILAGASACFAAAGPVLGGVLTAIDWRLVFLINVPLAIIALVAALFSVPGISATGTLKQVDWLGSTFFAVAMIGLVLALSRGQPTGWLSLQTIVPAIIAVVAAIAFVRVERRSRSPLIEARLFRQRNFTASTISQLVAGMLELGLGFLLPFYLLLVIGVGPVTAGLALIPSTIPIILAGPLAGRMFDRIGGRVPLTVGFGILAVSGIALAVGVAGGTILTLVPGLLLQGIGLGIVLTVNDPVGMNALEDSEQGAGAGIINTAEQVGGAIGIAGLGALQLGYYLHVLERRLAEQGITPTPDQVTAVKAFIAQAEQRGLRNVPQNPTVERVYDMMVSSHALSFQVAFVASSGLAVVGAISSWVLVRRGQASVPGRVFGRRSRWLAATPGGIGEGLTRRPGSSFDRDPPP